MNRHALLRIVENDDRPWDVAVVGGGASGLGTALAAVARGYRTILVEQGDFAQGTSSRSTKLMHGGVRYLRQGRIGLVRQALRERGWLLTHASKQVRPRAFVIPVFAHWEALYYGLGLKLYDLLAGPWRLDVSRKLSRGETLEALPGLRTDTLRGGVQYWDAQFDDARLAIDLVQAIVRRGGVALNYMQALALLKTQDKVTGLVARDLESGREYTLKARAVINATGVFTDAVRRLDDPEAKPLIVASQGVHLVFDSRFLAGTAAMMIPKTRDGRVLFAIPWHGRVIAGTTDTPVERIDLEPRPRAEEVDYLLEHLARYLSPAPGPADIRSVFAGLRPLIRSGRAVHTARLSRDHRVVVSRSGLITLTGGKWTTFRLMGEEAVDRAAQVGELPRCPPATLQLDLSQDATAEDFEQAFFEGAPAECVDSRIAELARENPEWDKPLHPALPWRLVHVVWAVRHEMARTIEDVLSRRLRALIMDARSTLEAAPAVARLMATVLGRDTTWEQNQLAKFQDLAQGYLPPRQTR